MKPPTDADLETAFSGGSAVRQAIVPGRAGGAACRAARQYLAAHPEIAELPSYEALGSVSQMRDGILRILASQGIKGGGVLGPDGAPYYQLIAVGNPTDPDAVTYRVTAGGGPVRQAINQVYSDGRIPWSDVH